MEHVVKKSCDRTKVFAGFTRRLDESIYEKRARHTVPDSLEWILPPFGVGNVASLNGSMSGKRLCFVSTLRLEIEEQGNITGQHEGRKHDHLAQRFKAAALLRI